MLGPRLDKSFTLDTMLVIIKCYAFPNGLVIFWLGGLGKELEGLFWFCFKNKYFLRGLKDAWSKWSSYLGA